MRLVDTPITVKTALDGRPVSFTYRDHTYHITSIIDRWRYMGRWWAGEGEWRFWRVETTGGGEFELLYDVQAEQWRLYQIYD